MAVPEHLRRQEQVAGWGSSGPVLCVVGAGMSSEGLEPEEGFLQGSE